MNNVVGVNEQAIDVLSIKILKNNDEISTCLNNISDAIESSVTFYDCDAGNTLRSRIGSVKDYFMTIQANLEVYSQDLIRAKANFTSTDNTVSSKVVGEAINDFRSRTNNLNAREEK